MKEIGEAYAILSDQEKKATYDRGDEFDQQQGTAFNICFIAFTSSSIR